MAGFERGVRPIGDWSTSITLSKCSTPSNVVVLAGLHPRAVEPVRERLADDLVHERRLARARDARDADELPERELDVDGLQVVHARAAHPERAEVLGAPLRHRDRPLAGEELARDRLRRPLDLAAVPSATTRPPCSPAPGPMSIRWSAARIICSSCSTTSTVLPRSRSRSSVSISRPLSRWCRPIDGSSRM